VEAMIVVFLKFPVYWGSVTRLGELQWSCIDVDASVNCYPTWPALAAVSAGFLPPYVTLKIDLLRRQHSSTSLAHATTSIPPPNMASPKPKEPTKLEPTPVAAPEIFPPDEEQQLLSESNTEKASANKAFTTGEYNGAIQSYEKALAVCPSYLEYDIAVLRSNIAACHLKLEEWKQAVESATQALDALDRLDPPPPKPSGDTREIVGSSGGGGGGVVGEIDDTTEVLLDALTRTHHTINDVHKLRTKALLRRAKARHELGGWASLQGSLEDYQALAKPPNQLSSLDMRAVIAAMRKLPNELEEAKNQEMADMMGKLKQLGNGILKPFGLSTENFQFTKDEGSGGYSMNFNQK
jgi:tetratricopeptide (TPR) repeat protein